jgi:hypothetical protein
MKNIEGMLEDWQPRTMNGIRRLVEICLAIQVHAAVEGPEENFGCGPVIEYLKNIRAAPGARQDPIRTWPSRGRGHSTVPPVT